MTTKRKHKNKKMKHPLEPPRKVKKVEEIAPEESDDGEDMLQMVDQEDLEFVKEAIANRSYTLYNKVKYTSRKSQLKKASGQDDESLETQYESIEKEPEVEYKSLLPLKTKHGIVQQKVKKEVGESKQLEETSEDLLKSAEDVDNENEDVNNENDKDFYFQESRIDITKPVLSVQLLAIRNELLSQRKVQIGSLSASLLENPEERVTNLRNLLAMMNEDVPEVYITVRKLIIASLLEVFKDLLPSYQIKSVKQEGVKLKKDTLKLHKYEENLLLYYKKFLQKLEKCCFMLKAKKGNYRSDEEKKLAELAIHAMCDLLVTHPYFNFSQNIAKVIVPFLSHSNKNVRDIVKIAIKTIFKADKKGEITLEIIRIINSYLKLNIHKIRTEMLEVLLVLKLSNVNLDQEKEDDVKQKKLNAKKHKILQLSKKEKKRKKKLKELETELLETKAEENRTIKQQNITDITKLIFNIYFRILKNSTNTKVLGVCLEGLAKFAHCINLDFYVDLVNVLDNLLKQDWLGYREHLHCIQTVFTMLSGHGEALTIDPTRFYTNLYKGLLTTSAARNHEDSLVLLKTVNEALVKRRKKVTNKRKIGFVKRLATLSLQLLHNGSLGCLVLLKNTMQLNRAVDVLLDCDNSIGDGHFQANVDDPEYANASSSALYEMIPLRQHYHPIVRKYANHIINYGDGKESIPMEYGKFSTEEIYEEFTMAEMTFNPAVPVPKKASAKARPQKFHFRDTNFGIKCKSALHDQQKKFSKLCTV